MQRGKVPLGNFAGVFRNCGLEENEIFIEKTLGFFFFYHFCEHTRKGPKMKLGGTKIEKMDARGEQNGAKGFQK